MESNALFREGVEVVFTCGKHGLRRRRYQPKGNAFVVRAAIGNEDG